MKSFLKFSIPVLAAMALSAVSFGGEPKVTICHYPPGNPANFQLISIGASAVNTHVTLHGDQIAGGGGECGPENLCVCPGPTQAE